MARGVLPGRYVDMDIEHKGKAMDEVAGSAVSSVVRAISSLEQLATEAPSSRELVTRWRDFEGALLAQLREDERTLLPLLAQPSEAELALKEHERIRNLAWEIAITTDLGCVHLRAIRKLEAVLRQRAEQRAAISARRPHRGEGATIAR